MEQEYRMMMKELPEMERPREKMLHKGVQALSEAELVAILLRTGTRDIPVNRLADQLLKKYQLAGLGNLSPQELSKNRGIGLVKAVTLAAGIELGKRLSIREPSEKPVVRSPQDAAELMMPRLRDQVREQFITLLLSTKNHVLATPVITTGTLNTTVVHPREVFREAIHYSAASMILVHNHPSGDPAPSREDVALTRKLVEAGLIMDIAVLDHVIIGDGRYVSLKEKGML
ncbi:MAG TPA: DNA repair protein RadC [Patescibacteria group bacterium]|nr:DNA repair protein RadC [Patescibacteria group bacterium]